MGARARLGVLCCCGLLLAACEDRNKYQPPPAAEVGVQKPEQKRVTLYLEVTGNTSAFNKVDLVARVQGFLEKVAYKEGDVVQAGTTLFVIEQAPYQTSLQIAEATVRQQEALLVQADADLGRQQSLAQRQVASEARLDESRAKRDSTVAALDQAKGQVQQAKINLAYTDIKAPFTGVVTARLVDPGALVGAGAPTKLATIVQIDPIYVNFNVNEQQVLQIREQLRKEGLTLKDLGPIPVEVGTQTETGFPHKGVINYVAPDLDQSTGTLPGQGAAREQAVGAAAGAVRARKGADATRRRGAAGARPRARQRPAGALRAHRQRQEHRRAAPGGDRRGGRRRVADHQKRAPAPGPRGRERHPARGAGQRREASRRTPRQGPRGRACNTGSGGCACCAQGQAMIAKFFIERPIFANVIAVLTIILGLVALARLPVAQYPNIVPPTVQVTARYPGASASTVVRDVGLPIEQKVNGVEGMIYMSSMSTSDGTYTLTVTFKIGTDADKAQILVQNRVSSALPALPSAVQTQGVQTAKRSTSILEIVALSSDGRYDSLFLSNYATINLVDELARVDGVGNVSVFGAGQYAMRLWLDPQKMQVRKLVPADVINAVNLQSRSTGAGQLGLPPVPAGQTFQYTINVPSKLDDVTQFEDIIIKADTDGTGRITRLRDVATVELGAQQYSQTFKLNGQPSAGVAVFQLPEANALDVAKRVETAHGRAAEGVPARDDVERALRHHQVRRRRHPRGLQDADRGRDSRADRDPRIPAGLARDAGARHHRSRHHHRRVRGDGGVRLHGQPDDAVCHHPRHRHRRRRRDRRRGGRGKAHRARPLPARRDRQGHGRAAGPDHRHHAGADGGVRAGGLPAGLERADVPAVRDGDRGHGRHQRDQRADPEARAVRPVDAPVHAAGAAQHLLSRLQPRL